MKTTKKNLLFVLILLGLQITVQSQDKYVILGDQEYNNKHFISAIDYYNKALEKFKGDNPEGNEVAFKLAECYRMTNNAKKSEQALQQLIRNKYAENKPVVYLHCANAQVIEGKYTEALVLFDKYLEKVPDDPNALTGQSSCRMSMQDTANDPSWTIKNIKEINSLDDDFAAIFGDAKSQSVIFTSNRKGSTGKETDNWTNGSFSDLFIAIKRKGVATFSAPVLLDMGEVVNTLANEGTGVLYNDYKRLLYTRCAKMVTGTEYCRIFQSERQGNSWVNSDLVYSDNSGNVGQPAITSDGLTMYFASGQPGGKGGKDLWKTTRPAVRKPFGPAENLGEMINTSGDEMFPSLLNDTILCFASDGRPGYGGLDIYRVNIGKDGPSNVDHMPRPINSCGDDFAMSFDRSGEKGFFTSRRPGGRGGDDIYSFEQAGSRKINVYGSLKDEMTASSLSKLPVLLIINDSDTLTAITDDPGNFRFDDIAFTKGNNYTLLLEKEKYFTRRIGFAPARLLSDTTYRFSLTLQRIPGKPVVLPDIYYEFDKWDLQPQYRDSLMTLVTILKDNPGITIELASHTDSRGTDQHNDELSQKRAESVVLFLAEKGIDKDRLVAKGYGKRVPRVLNTDVTRDGYVFSKGTTLSEEYINSIPEEKKREAAYQLNRRTEFRVINQNAR